MDFLKELGIDDQNSGAFCGRWLDCAGASFDSHAPATGERIASVKAASRAELEQVTSAAHEAFLRWREVPAPVRGEYVRRMGERMRDKKEALGRLLTFEMGKILEEGRGEIQECIDIADFAVGLSRQLYGLTIASERPQHSMRETWHPLGNVGVITAFNFPAAVWAWNAMLALVCGDSVVWKPSEKTPLIAIAMIKLCAEVLEEDGFGALVSMVVGSNDDVAIPMTEDPRYPLISATGSTRMGKAVGQVVAGRLGRSLLELGGNNAVICLEDADLDMVLRAVLFGAVGTAGQRCTTTRRLLIHKDVRAEFEQRLLAAYEQVRIGDPLEASTLMGPLIDKDAIDNMQRSLEAAKGQGGELLCGGDVLTLDGALAGGNFVSPAIVRIGHDAAIVQHETFAPILYVIEIEDMEHAMRLHNSVPQGLSSAIFTSDVRKAERFLSAVGSDCGIANVNLGTSGAEIGGAFGGEKETGGGRESGSDSWKAYMRRQTSTVNWGSELPLAQGITFG